MNTPPTQRPLIIGTAGHIDHGKTALIRALTGIDADRLPEEQARGMTIDLGFAFAEFGGRRVGMVDVPGHEKFIRNMVAGATGVDLVLLVVAADDAVMPQTREHLEIVELLGVQGGIVALNKIDLVDEHRIEQSRRSVEFLLKGTRLEGSPIIPVSAVTGAGIETLRERIGQRIDQVAWRPWPTLFRLPIDRRFSLQGHGTVVTGSLMGGDVHAGDEVEFWPRGKKVRVRSAQSHGSSHQGLQSGRRVAVNLPNIKVAEIHRGDELASVGYLRPSRRLAVRLRNLPSSPLLIEPGELLRLHMGTASANASFALLGAHALEPGEEVFALMQTSEPVMAAHGQRFILRSSAHGVTIGGGSIIFTHPPRMKLNQAAPAWLVRLESEDDEVRVLAALEVEPALGGNVRALCRETGLQPQSAELLLQRLANSGRILRSPGAAASGYWTQAFISQTQDELVRRIRAALEKHRPRLALGPGPLLKETSDLGEPEFVQWMLGLLASDGRVRLEGGNVLLPDYHIELSSLEAQELDRFLSVYRAAGLCPEGAEEMRSRASVPAARAQALHALAVDRGDLIELNAELALHREIHGALLEMLRKLFAGGAGHTVSQLKDRLGISRKYAIPLCEHLDRRGFTRREGDLRYAGPKLQAPPIATSPPQD